MTDFKGIRGWKVQTLSSDPGATQFAAGSWASDAPAPQTTQSGGSFGTSTAAVSSGGYDGTAYVQTTIEFNGSAWSSGGSMNRPAGQSFPGFGTEPSGGIAGGYATSGNTVVNNFESYNGTSYTESTDLNSARQAAGATGASNTAGIVVGGTTGVVSPPAVTGNANVEIWNGTSWTEISEINTARHQLKALGSTCPAPTAVVAGGENSGTKTGATEKYDGSTWSESGDLNTARSAHGGAGSVATSGICFGGEGPAGGGYTLYANTEHFDGSTWTEVSDLSGTRYAFSTATGTGSAAIAAQGRNPGFTGLTEIWSAPSTFSKINLGQVYFNSTANAFKVTEQPVPGGTFASGGSLNTARTSAAGAGTQTAGMLSAGRGGPPSFTDYAITEFYDGSAWTEVNDMNTARYAVMGANAGSQTATLVFGGTPPDTAATESWDGTNWTEVNDLNTAGSSGTGFGTQPAAIAVAGDSRSNLTESWDGTSWTEVSEINTTRAQMAGFGLATAGLIVGGDLYPVTSPTRLADQTELWDGTSWTETGDLNTGRRRIGQGGFGTQTSGLTAGGYTATARVNNAESWNGTSWTEQSELSANKDVTTGVGSGAASGFIAGGGSAPGAALSATEEWTVPETNKTITVS